MKTWRLKRLPFLLVVLAFMGVFFLPVYALAGGTHDGSGDGSGSPDGGGASYGWKFDTTEKLGWWLDEGGYTSYDNWAPFGNYQGHWNLPTHDYGLFVYGGGKLWNYGWINFDWLFDRPLECDFNSIGAGSNIANLPGWAAEQANEDGYYLGGGSRGSGLWYNPQTNKYLDAIYYDSSSKGHWEERDYWKDVIVYEEEGLPGNIQTKIDCKKWSAEDKYKNAPTSAEYEHTTEPGDTTDNYKVHAEIQTIHCHEWWWQKADGSWSDWGFSYNIESINEYSKTIHYGTSLPSVNQEYYAPLNVNRQGYAEVGDCDITRNYVNGKKLDASVTNAQNRSNNSDIETLDLNADTNFTIKFNNDVLGLDASKNWNSSPPELKNGNWEYVEGAAYANGRILPGDDYYRYDLALNAAISTNITKSVDTASIVVNGHEYTASETYKSFVKNAPIRKIDASARFIYIGRYKLQSGITGAHFPNYWTATYNTATFFEYGVSYRGRITTSGIEAPQIVRGQGDVSQSGADNTIKTSYEKKQRGLYVGVKRQACQQPIVCATFNVKTVAGDLRD